MHHIEQGCNAALQTFSCEINPAMTLLFISFHFSPVESTLSRTGWTPFPFRYDGSFCACHGDQYVKLLGGSENELDYGVRYVGVVLCQTPSHYKIFLANDLEETFL